MSFSKEEIRKIRKRLGKTQTEFGEMLGVGLRIVQRWEKGERVISKSAEMLLESIVAEHEEPDSAAPVPKIVKITSQEVFTDVSDRLKELIIQKGLNYSSLGALIGYSDVSVGKLVKGLNKPKYEAIKGILESFPDLSARWLLTGEGYMYRTESKKEKKLEEYHPLEIVEHIDKERYKFSKRRLFQKLILSFVNEGVIADLERELAEELNSGKHL